MNSSCSFRLYPFFVFFFTFLVCSPLVSSRASRYAGQCDAYSGSGCGDDYNYDDSSSFQQQVSLSSDFIKQAAQAVGPFLLPSLYRPSCGLKLSECVGLFSSSHSVLSGAFASDAALDAFLSIYSSSGDSLPTATSVSLFGAHSLCACSTCLPPQLVERAQQKFQCERGVAWEEQQVQQPDVKICEDEAYRKFLGLPSSLPAGLASSCSSVLQRAHSERLAAISVDHPSAYEYQGAGGGRPLTRAGAPAEPDQAAIDAENAAANKIIQAYGGKPLAKATRVPITEARPNYPILVDNPNLALVRAQIRQQPAENNLNINGFQYTEDVDGKIVRAQGRVIGGPGSDPGNMATHYCDALWNPTNAQGGAQRDGKTWTRGHIIAASLGGTNYDPANFFPHHTISNSGDSEWHRMEQIALAVHEEFKAARAEARAEADKCFVRVIASFDYPLVFPREVNRALVPSGGSYTVSIDGDVVTCTGILVTRNTEVFRRRHVNGNMQAKWVNSQDDVKARGASATR